MTTSIYATLTPLRSGLLSRSITGLVIGFFVTTGLFWLMQYLIESTEFPLDEKPMVSILDFVQPQRKEEVERKIRKPTAPPPPEEQPLIQTQTRVANPGDTTIDVGPTGPLVMDKGGKPGGIFDSFSEGDYLPIVKVAPVYPNRALSRGVEGSCIVQYTVTTLGTIKDVVVIEDQCSSSAFHNSSINAALKFKYKPRVVGGVPVEVPGVQNKFTYKIE